MKKIKIVTSLFLVMLIFIGCESDDTTEIEEIEKTGANQTISGKIEKYNNTIKLGIGDNVVVDLLKDGKKVKSTTSNSTGKYSFSDVEEGTYSIFLSKEGYYNMPIRKVYKDHYNYVVTKDTVITADLRIYKKATVGIESIFWRQGNKNNGDDDNGIVLDITFKNLDLSKIDKYVYIYFFAGYNDKISKENFTEKLDQADGNGWTLGYARAWILKDKIKDNKVKGYWDSRFCGWRGGSLKSAKRPSHIAVYTTNALGGGVDGLVGDDYVAIGEQYSGINDERILKNH